MSKIEKLIAEWKAAEEAEFAAFRKPYVTKREVVEAERAADAAYEAAADEVYRQADQL